MKTVWISLLAILCQGSFTYAQNVFDPNDAIVRYDKSRPLGSAENPNPALPGLQKWVSTPTNGVTAGSSTIDVSSFKQYLINYKGTPVAFRIKFPRSYKNADSVAKKYPMMLFLHGAGEVGCPSNNGIYNNEKQLWLGGGLFRDFVDQNKFDGFLLYPQLVNPEGCWGAWGTASSASLQTVIAMVDTLVKYARADIDRLLVNGLSGGGYGAWRMADAFPQRVAKIIPSASAGNTTGRMNYVHIPIWFATGGKDPDPSPAQALYTYNRLKEIGADIRYTQYPELGHSVWYSHWREPDYAAAMNDMHKANPLVFFQRNEFCANENINAKLGVSAGFFAYEWQRDGQTIATRTGTVNTIQSPEHVINFTGNEISVKSFGNYRVRFKRTSISEWCAFSPKPAVVKMKNPTMTPPIVLQGGASAVLPAPDGSTTSPLMMPAGYSNYEWFNAADTSLVAKTQIFNAPAGEYIARYTEQYGCGTLFSPKFRVVNANGASKPDPATDLVAVPLSPSIAKLSWKQGSGETGFEIYRSSTSGGSYKYISMVAANSISFNDSSLNADQIYYYIVRAVGSDGGAPLSNEAVLKTAGDVIAPTAPTNLQYRGSTPTSVSLRWNASTDNNQVKRYDLFVNGKKLYSTAQTVFTVNNLEPSRYYNFCVKAVDAAGNVSSPSNQAVAFTHEPSVNYRYYVPATSWSVLPNFNALTPSKTGTVDSIDINNTTIKTAMTKYGFVWQSYLYVPESANYTLETRSDDGSKLYIDVPYAPTATALVVNDSIHGMRSRTGTKFLTQGYHLFTVTYFQGSNGMGLELYWSNDAGVGRELIGKNFFTTVAVPAPQAVKATEGFAVESVSHDKVKLKWVGDMSSSAGYEIVRSVSATTGFVPVATIEANVQFFTDSGLSSSKNYYYKIRTITSNSASTFSTPLLATTLKAPAVPIAATQLRSIATTTNFVTLSWADNSTNESGFRIYRAGADSVFSLIATAGINTTAFTDSAIVPKSIYSYYISPFNSAGEGSKSNITAIKNANVAPAIGTLNSIFVKTGQLYVQDIIINDDPEDLISAVILQRPAFVQLTKSSSNLFQLTVEATADDVGYHELTLIAADNFGKSTSVSFAISVSDSKTRSVYVNFGAAGKSAPMPWNNWLGNRAANNTIGSLKDEAGIATTISLTTITSWSTTTVIGHITGNNSGVAPDAVLESGLADNGNPKVIRIGGLNKARIYNVEFIGSQNEGLPAVAYYTSVTQQSELNARYNTTRSANLNGLVPDINGQITVTITRAAGSAYTYLNGLKIEEVSNGGMVLNPHHLYAEVLGMKSVLLTWSDRSSNEDQVNGYEVQRSTDSLFDSNLSSVALPGETTWYMDSIVQANTAYWYRVRAISGGVPSSFSNKFRITTPSGIVHVNFNSTTPDAAAPWNNLNANALAEFQVDNLLDQNGKGSGIKISCTRVFNGEFTAGANTGNNSGIVPDNVLMSSFWIDNSQLSQVKLSGLDQSKRYRIGFLGSASSPGWFKGNYTATYTIGKKTAYLNSWMNTSKMVYVEDITTDENGEIVIDFSTTQAAQWAFNAGFILQMYDDAQGSPGKFISNAASIEQQLEKPMDSDRMPMARAYPNPFTSDLYVPMKKVRPDSRVSIEIYDINGSVLFSKEYTKVAEGTTVLHLRPVLNVERRLCVLVVRVNGKVEQYGKILKAGK